MKRALLVFALFLSLVIMMLTVKPSLDAIGIIFVFFIVLYTFVYQFSLLIFYFLKTTMHQRLISGVIAGSVTGVLILLTFKALRVIDVVLLICVVVLVTWYVSRARE